MSPAVSTPDDEIDTTVLARSFVQAGRGRLLTTAELFNHAHPRFIPGRLVTGNYPVWNWPPHWWKSLRFPEQPSIADLIVWLDDLVREADGRLVLLEIKRGRGGKMTEFYDAVNDLSNFANIFKSHDPRLPRVLAACRRSTPDMWAVMDLLRDAHRILSAEDAASDSALPLDQSALSPEVHSSAQADSSPEPMGTTVQSGVSAQPSKATKGKNIDARMWLAVAQNPDSIGWSARQWAEYLGCGKSTVIETKTWQDRLPTVRATLALDGAGGMDQSDTSQKGRRRTVRKTA